MPFEGPYNDDYNPISALFPQMNNQDSLFPQIKPQDQTDNSEYENEHRTEQDHRETTDQKRASCDSIPSIPSHVINQLVKDIDLEDSDRFKYLNQYETIINADNNINQPPLINYENLNDFEKYDKQTRLNDLIQEKVEKKFNNEKFAEQDLIITPNNLITENLIGEFDNESISYKPAKRMKDYLHGVKFPKFTKSKDQDNFQQEKIFTSSSTFSSTLVEQQQPIQRNLLHRNLEVRHLQMIAFGATLGVGLFLNAGKSLSIAGPLGALLGYVITGLIVLATMVSFCEMVTLISVADGISGFSSRFIDDSFGFSVGWLYFLSFALGLPAEIIAACIMLSYYGQLNIPGPSTTGWIFLFLFLIFSVNLFDVSVFGEIEYISSLVKLTITFLLVILMIILNRGGLNYKVIGFTYWDSKKDNLANYQTYGPFRPTFDLQDFGTGALNGIGGNKGRFLGVLVSVLIASYALSGTEIVCIAAIEAKNPRKALPSATKRVFWRIVFFYCLSIFCVGLNVYAGDPRLLRYYSSSVGSTSSSPSNHYLYEYSNQCNSGELVYAGFANGNQSPWIIAFQNASLCNVSAVLNGFLIFFALSAGISQVYVSSRTLYSLSIQKKAPKFLSNCNKYGVPYNAVLFAGSFGLLSFLSINHTATVVFQNLTNIVATSGILAWFSMCFAFLRFFYALKLRPDIISRNDKAYPYKSPFQPYTAIFGLFGSGTIILLMGFVVFLHDEWDTLFFMTSYGSLMLFVILYLGYKMVKKTRFLSLDQLDLDSGRREMDRIAWDEDVEYTNSFKELFKRCISFLA